MQGRRPTDPLLAGRETRGEALARWAIILGATLLLHLLVIGAIWVIPSSTPPEDDGDNTVEVAIVESEPEPQSPEESEPAPQPVEEPAPEPPPQPEPPEPEPEPQPDPEPEPEPKKPAPEPEPQPQPPDPQKQESASKEAESMEAVELEGLTMESTVEGGEGPTMKVGKGIESGEITDNYVDPDRMDAIETGEGDGAGRGASDTPGTGSTPRNCPNREASVKSKARVSPDDYPMQAKRRGVEGEIVGLVTVGPDGSVQNVEIVQGLGSGLDELTRKAFEQWTFEPARRDCQPVASKVRVRHRFNLAN